MPAFSRLMPIVSRCVGWPWLAAGLAVSLSVGGCATLPPVPVESTRVNWGNMVVAPARYPPKSNFHGFAVGQKAGAAKGAASGAGLALFETAAVASQGALEALVAPYLLVVGVPVATAAGAIYGGRAAISEQDAAALQAHIQESLITLRVSATLARAIADLAQQDTDRRLPLLADTGPGTPGAPTPARPGVRELSPARCGRAAGLAVGRRLRSRVSAGFAAVVRRASAACA